MAVVVGELLSSLPHGFSHFRITLHAYRCGRTGGRPRTEREWRWVRPESLSELAFPRAYRKTIEAITPK